MGFNARKTLRIGPFFIRLGTGGKSRFKSWGIKIGRYTYNVTNSTSTFDTPGPGSYQRKHDRRNG